MDAPNSDDQALAPNLSLTTPIDDSSAQVSPPPLLVDRLSSLPAEIHIIIFAYLRQGITTSKIPVTSLQPLAHYLQGVQRINLLENVDLRNQVQFDCFCRSIRVNNLGHLVQNLRIRTINGDSIQEFQGLIEQMPQIRSIICRHYELGRIVFDQIQQTFFTKLEKVNLRIRSSKRLKNLLTLKHLKEVRLVVRERLGDPIMEVEESNDPVDPVEPPGQLSLKLLTINGDISNPVIIEFIKAIDAPDVSLMTDTDDLLPAIAAINSKTVLLTLEKMSSTPQLLDHLQLARFSQLQSLTLIGSGIQLPPTFFSLLFQTPLLSLTVGNDFNLDARPLVLALLGMEIATKRLKKLRLDNIDLYRAINLGIVCDTWPDACDPEQIASIVLITQFLEIELSRTTMNAYTEYLMDMEVDISLFGRTY